MRRQKQTAECDVLTARFLPPTAHIHRLSSCLTYIEVARAYPTNVIGKQDLMRDWVWG